MSSIMKKLKQSSTIKTSSVLSESEYFGTKDLVTTKIPILNVMFSGRLDGGFAPGLTVWAGPSKHFKTAFSLLMAKSYLDKYPDSAILFYDSEFGTPISYFESFGIDIKRVIHTPITDIEELKFDIMKQLSALDGTEKVMIVVDSIGNLASKKEVDDAMEQKGAADMTRAKQLKSLFRMVTPHLTMKNIPMVVVNHTYKEMGLYPKDIVSGGTGVMYSASNVYIVGRQQDKDGKELLGYHFIVNVEKSRFVREKSKVPVTVSFDGGISTWSGLLDIALESGHVTKPSNGWYQRKGDTAKSRMAATDSKEFWMPILTNKEFSEYIHKHYSLGSATIMNNDEIEDSYNWVDDNA